MIVKTMPTISGHRKASVNVIGAMIPLIVASLIQIDSLPVKVAITTSQLLNIAEIVKDKKNGWSSLS